MFRTELWGRISLPFFALFPPTHILSWLSLALGHVDLPVGSRLYSTFSITCLKVGLGFRPCFVDCFFALYLEWSHLFVSLRARFIFQGASLPDDHVSLVAYCAYLHEGRDMRGKVCWGGYEWEKWPWLLFSLQPNLSFCYSDQNGTIWYFFLENCRISAWQILERLWA